MSTRSEYPAGVPCWVDVMVNDPEGSRGFYGEVFGWEFAGPGPMPDGGGYFVARHDGGDVAGLGSMPPGLDRAVWATHVAVDSVADAVARARAAGGSVVAAPFEAPPAGRGAAIADPSGGVIGVWEAAERHGCQRVNQPSAWAMSALQSTDPEAAIAFYAEVFGWSAWEMPGGPEGLKLFRLEGFVGGEPTQPVPRDVVAAIGPAQPGTPSFWAVDFWIEDVARAVAVAEARGGSVIAPVHTEPPFHRAVLACPEGAAFSVSQLDLAMLAGQ